MSRSIHAALVIACLLVAGCEQLREDGAQARNNASKIHVEVCTDQGPDDDCEECSDASARGLSFKTNRGNPAKSHRVSCRNGNGPPCLDESRVEWMFKGQEIEQSKYYHVRLQYDESKPTNSSYPPSDFYGTITDNDSGPTFNVLAPAPPTQAEAIWPYSVHLYDTTNGAMTLIACADPEIIIDR